MLKAIKYIKKYKWNWVVTLFVATLLVWYILLQESNKLLEVSFLDVGQGDAIFIDTPSDNQILIDGGGPNGKVLRELRKLMPFYDRSIDVIVATHPDQDHIGGLIGVLERYKIGLVVDSGTKHTTDAYREKEKLIKEKNVSKIEGRKGTKLDLGDGVVLEILFPDRDVVGFKPNEASIIAKLSYNDHEFLLTGDAPKNIENYVVTLSDVKSDVLKVAHHGSKTSTGAAFIGSVNPSFAIISSGEDNRYGHPHQEVLDILEEFDVNILRTSELGTITFTSNGRDLKIK